MPDDSDRTLILEVPRTNLSFCEFDVPLAQDRFTLSGLTPGQRYQVTTFDLGALADTLIDILDGDGRSIALNDDGPARDGSSSVEFLAPAATVDVEIRSVENRLETGNVGPSQGYSLLASANIVVAPEPCSPDSSEENDVEANAAGLGSGTTDSGLALNFCDDTVDYFLLNVVPGEMRQFNTFGLGINADTSIEVFAGPT